MKHIYFSLAVVLINMTLVYSSPVKENEAEYPFTLYTREDWGAEPATDGSPLTVPVPYVVIHHTAVPAACYSKAGCSAAMKSMQNYHKSLGWGDIGYNFCVGSEGGAYEGRGWNVKGIHARGANSYSIGISLIGDWRYELPPAAQLQTTKSLISVGVKKGFISPKYKLIGHMQVTPTECPGTMLFNEISSWDHFTPGPFSVATVKQ